jgi:hypothetical protein
MSVQEFLYHEPCGWVTVANGIIDWLEQEIGPRIELNKAVGPMRAAHDPLAWEHCESLFHDKVRMAPIPEVESYAIYSGDEWDVFKVLHSRGSAYSIFVVASDVIQVQMRLSLT